MAKQKDDWRYYLVMGVAKAIRILNPLPILFWFLSKFVGEWECPRCGSHEFYKTYRGIRCANDSCDYRKDWR